MSKIKLGLLDFGYRRKNTSGISVLNDMFEYASLADDLGFSSLWLSEHHNSGQGWSNPEMLLPVLASYTKTINIGVAGILMAIHSPYRVALNFKTLSTIFPGRIDLGLANGYIDPLIDLKFNNCHPADWNYTERFNKRTSELLHYLHFEKQLLSKEKTFIPPFGGDLPTVFRLSGKLDHILGSVKSKMHHCKSTFHSEELDIFDKRMISECRRRFFELHGSELQIRMAVSGLCAVNMINAKRNFLQLETSTLKTAKKMIVGCPSLFRDKLEELQDQSGIDHFIFYDQSLSPRSRRKTLELLAKEFTL
ncbi:LLM class flavin-dependent oxidoreductase [Mucilaginibacter terrenus]|uniref:LLM class flavin-dependent oxidoreductase n=1 Tax=Mucilaginibacter terrenus TaxID=2482727 RepID=A0A3E2NVX6_9SPHI|nr:LLM class flavin-dependent oxidoreductase [Mucilaginibacter terrenus]RFZ85164.1 LLM class flavin-dependent oxidoreductase [Mucilaginibacter terrenus]